MTRARSDSVIDVRHLAATLGPAGVLSSGLHLYHDNVAPRLASVRPSVFPVYTCNWKSESRGNF